MSLGHSFKNEDAIIFNAVKDISQGRFLDIGAYDGVNYSNTLCLLEAGWSGIMVEPGLEAFQKLLKNHGDNPNVILIHAAVGADLLHLSKFWDNHETFSTTLESNRDKFIHEGFSQQYWVPAIWIVAVLMKFPGRMDVVSIDTEGTSVDLFKAFPFHMARPCIFCVEHDNRLKECQDFAAHMGYKVIMQNEENFIFGDTEARV